MNPYRIITPTVDSLEIERITVVRFRQDSHHDLTYCAAVHQRFGDEINAGVVYRVSSDSPFPEALDSIIGYLHRELWPKRQITQIGWADVGFGLDLARKIGHQVRTGRCNSNGAIEWTDADLRTQRTWADRTQAAVEVLLRLGA
jgi:hypothetical protein